VLSSFTLSSRISLRTIVSFPYVFYLHHFLFVIVCLTVFVYFLSFVLLYELYIACQIFHFISIALTGYPFLKDALEIRINP